MYTVDVSIQCEDDACLPEYGSALAAGADVRAHIKAPMVLEAGGRALVPTGIRVEIPEGFELQVRPRSGFALKHGITVLNTPGTIDADYRGEIGVILVNLSEAPFTVEPGMRIAQIVLAPVVRARFVAKAHLAETVRGGGGFGHTGTV